MTVPPAVHDVTSSIFRPQAVAELDAQRRMDARLRVVSPRRWLVLMVIALLALGAVVWAVFGKAPTSVSGAGALLPPDGLVQVVAPAAGIVSDVPGVDDAHPDTAAIDVTGQQPLLGITLPDGTSTVITPPAAGVLVARSPLAVGSTIVAGEVLGQILPTGGDAVALLFVSQAAAAAITPAMTVRLNPETAPAGAFGDLLGTVRGVDALPLDDADFVQLAGGNTALAETMAALGSYRVVVDLGRAGTPSGYRWSSRTGPPFVISPGTALTGEVITGEQTAFDTLLGG